jgi:subtilisin-like proprotein convertase family protein
MDEVRISKTKKSIGEINSQMFTSLNESNDNDSYTNVVYNLDASMLPNTNEGSRLYMRGGASFTFNGAFTSGFVQSPINSLATVNFQNGYQMKLTNKRVPSTGTTGIVRDTIEILNDQSISDLDLFIALNHNAENNIKLSLKSPAGTTVDFFNNTQLATFASNIVTVFDSDADSSLISNRYINFGPRIKPEVDFDVAFGGINQKGKWVLTINDEAGSDTGFVTAWGLRFNNSNSTHFRLECSSLIEGMYNATTNTLTGDTVTYFLKLTDGVTVVDSAKVLVNNSGTAIPEFTKAQPMTSYFLILKHRNSLETWSSTVITFSQLSNQAVYNFVDAQSKAFGDNMKQVDSSPLKFAVYSGDVNQDGTVDATDVSTIDNDASNFVSGYVVTDLTGDNFVDGTDFAIADNNAANFVSVVRP